MALETAAAVGAANVNDNCDDCDDHYDITTTAE